MESKILRELCVALYQEFEPGKYKSHAGGMIDISTMAHAHISNSIAALIKKREDRYTQILKLKGNDEFLLDIKQDYSNMEDLMGMKITELQDELNKRAKNSR